MAFVDRKIAAAFTAASLMAIASFAAFSGAASAAQLVVISSRHCPYCVAWEREIGSIYSRTDEGRLAPPRRIDIEAGRPADLGRIRPVEVSPTFILVDQGYEVGRIVGYNGPGSFWPQLRRLLARLRSPERPGGGWGRAAGI